jgi:hypothetical protein
MKKNEVQIGATYQVSVTGKLAPVRIVRENPHGGWNGVNVDTKREVRVKSAQRLRKRIEAAPRALPSERLGVPPTTPGVDAKVKAAEAAANAAPLQAAQDAPGAAQAKDASKDYGGTTGRATCDPGANGRPSAERLAESLADALQSIAGMPPVAPGADITLGDAINAYHGAVRIARDAVRFYNAKRLQLNAQKDY